MEEMIESIKKITFDKNDILVLTCEQDLSDDQVTRIAEQIKGFLPEGTKILLLAGGIQLSVLTEKKEGEICPEMECPSYNNDFSDNCVLLADYRAKACIEYKASKAKP